MRTVARLWLSRARWLVLAVLACGCALPAVPSLCTVPPCWRNHHPFGPEANAARARGELTSLCEPARAEEWNALARACIRDGDVLFRLGRSRTLHGQFTSLVLADVSDSRFSHAGLACWEGDDLWVYDTAGQGVRKVPFALWMMDAWAGHFTVKRLRPEFRDRIPAALAFCDDAYRRGVPYDYWFTGADDRLYCAALIELAFRDAGLELSEPLPIRCLPHYPRYCLVGLTVRGLTPLDVDRPIYALGNAYYGLYGSPCLELVYEGGVEDDTKRKPPRRPFWSRIKAAVGR